MTDTTSTLTAPEGPAPTARAPLAVPSRRSYAAYVAYVLLAAGVLLWISALPGIRHATPTDLGLLFAASPAFAASMVVLVVGFVVALRRGDHRAMGLLLLATIAVQRLTMPLTTDLPIYTWTFKHLGVVDYIFTHGALARGADVYHEWPGIFTATAWFSDVTGADPVLLAHWFTPVIHVLIALTMIGFARAAGLSRSTALTAAFIVELLNWVGQDYFAPQAAAFVLALAVLALLTASKSSPTAAALTVPLFAALTVTHQLTPFWLLGVSILLAALGYVRPRWLPVVFAAIAIAYLYPRLAVVTEYGLLTSLNPVENAASNVPTTGTTGRWLTMFSVRSLAVTLWLASAVSAVALRRRGEPVGLPLTIMFGAFSLLLAQSYGGEAIFRVYLYALPGCALLVAPVLVRVVRARIGRAGMASALVVAATLASMQGYFGAWFVNLVRPTELAVARSLLTDVQPPANITMAGPIWPERPGGRYVDFARFNGRYDSPMVWAAGLLGSSFADPSELEKVDRLMIGRSGVPNYLVISRQMKEYCDYYGIFPAGAMDRLRDLALDSPDWVVVHDSTDVTVFLFRGPGAPSSTTTFTPPR